ncbi:MAG: hypothetical protein V4671_28220 [Armatimonadota bacterium]
MTERPIIFSAPMVKAILEGRKSQTRRVLKFTKKQEAENKKAGFVPGCFHEDGGGNWIAWERQNVPGLAELTKRAYPNADGFPCPYGKAGDHLWVRENFQVTHDGNLFGLRYLADETVAMYWPNYDRGKVDEIDAFAVRHANGKALPSIFMPRWASRITLEIVRVRVERVTDISGDDAIAEGAAFLYSEEFKARYGFYPPGIVDGVCAQRRFISLWNELHPLKTGHCWTDRPFVWVLEFKPVTLGAIK